MVKPAKTTIQIVMSNLTAFLNRAIEHELIAFRPTRNTSRFFSQAKVRCGEIQPLSTEEVRTFLGKVREKSPRYFCLFLAAIHTGLRSSELAGLQWGDIDFNSKFLTVRRQYVNNKVVTTTKTGKIRRVDLSTLLVQTLRDLRRIRREEYLKKGEPEIPEWVFANRAGQPPDMQNLKNRHFLPNLQRAGLRRIRFHDLRHTFATLLIQNGEPLAYVKDQLGHSTIKLTVDTYTHWMPGNESGCDGPVAYSR